MNALQQSAALARRRFLTSTSSGIGLLALASMFRDDKLLAAEARLSGPAAVPTDPLAVRASHSAPKAKRCICIFLEGGPS